MDDWDDCDYCDPCFDWIDDYADMWAEYEDETQTAWEEDRELSDGAAAYACGLAAEMASAEESGADRDAMWQSLCDMAGQEAQRMADSEARRTVENVLDAVGAGELLLPDPAYAKTEAGGRTIDTAAIADALYATETLRVGKEVVARELQEPGSAAASEMARSRAVRGVAAYIAREVRGLEDRELSRVADAVSSYYRGEVDCTKCAAWMHAMAYPADRYYEAADRSVSLDALAVRLREHAGLLSAKEGTAWAAVPEKERDELAKGVIEEAARYLGGLDVEDVRGIQDALKQRYKDGVDGEKLHKSSAWLKTLDVLGMSPKTFKERAIEAGQRMGLEKGTLTFKMSFHATLLCVRAGYKVGGMVADRNRELLDKARERAEPLRERAEPLRERAAELIGR